MSFSFSRDRMAELRGSSGATSNDNYSMSDDEFGHPNRRPMGAYPQPSAMQTTPPPPQPTHEYAPAHETYEMTPTEQQPQQQQTQQQHQLQQPQQQKADLSTTNGFFDEIDRLKSDIDSVNYNIDQIANLHNNALSSLNEQLSKQTARDLERKKSETQQKNMFIKTRIQELENSNARLPNDGDTQMRRSQTAALRKRFLDTIQRYQDVERNYQLKYRQRIERQIRIVKPDASQDEVDDIIDSDDSPQVFAQSLMSAGRQHQSKAVLSEVQSRHMDIKHIEKTIIELHQLFMDMQMMVEQQGETLNQVEQHAETTQAELKQGNTYLTKAIATAKSTRAKKWCCFFLCIGICVMIAILVWWFAFGHVGADGSTGKSDNNNDNAITTSPGPTATPTTAPTATATATATTIT